VLLAAFLAIPLQVHAAATLTIVNLDPPLAGFNDPTPAAPVGGNPGTTVGQQRLNAFRFAARIWGATLTSRIPILIGAGWPALPCTDAAAVLGSSGPTEAFSDFPNAPLTGTWYHFALANKLSGFNLDPTNFQIAAAFNGNLGQPGCLTGTFFYYGLDNQHGANIDLVSVLLHEFAHGLGFLTLTDGQSGQELFRQPSVWDHFLLDNTTNKLWVNMTDAERAASALNSRNLVWNGNIVTSRAPLVLRPGTPQLTVNAPSSIAGKYQVGTATFGPALTSPGVTGELVPVVDTAPNLGLACNPLSRANAAAVNGKVALIDPGDCTFVVKVKNAQQAGAVGVIIADVEPGTPPADLGGSDPTITIPSASVSQSDGATLKSALQFRSRNHSGVVVNMGVDLAVLAGADSHGRALVFTPDPFQLGSSISHWDASAVPDLLMEPNLNQDLPHSVTVPRDLTFPLLRDTGW